MKRLIELGLRRWVIVVLMVEMGVESRSMVRIEVTMITPIEPLVEILEVVVLVKLGSLWWWHSKLSTV